jgi:hypothetical protein
MSKEERDETLARIISSLEYLLHHIQGLKSLPKHLKQYAKYNTTEYMANLNDICTVVQKDLETLKDDD